MAINIKAGIAPDEIYHISVSKAYSKTLLIPENTEGTYYLSDITRIPYLSYWINGRIINLNFTGIDDIYYLRFFSILVSAITIIITFELSKLIINKKYYNLVPPFLLVNTLMFSFLSASVSYDNPVNLLAILSIYLLARWIKIKNNRDLLLMLITLAFASLFKFTIIPLAIAEFLVTIFFIIKRNSAHCFIKDLKGKYKLYIFPIAILFSLVLTLYGTNFVKYNTFRPNCEDLLTTDQCQQNDIYRRDHSAEYTDISNLHELYLMMYNRLTPFEYIGDWTMAMTERTFGIMGHQNLYMPKILLNSYLLLFATTLVITIRKWKEKDKLESSLIFLFIFYTTILLFYQNYKTYLHRNIFEWALQGRYLFPVLPIFYIIQIKYLSDIKIKHFKYGLLIAILFIFSLGCIPFFFHELPETNFIVTNP